MVAQGLSKISAKTSESVESQRHRESQLRDLRALNALVEATTDNAQKKLCFPYIVYYILYRKYLSCTQTSVKQSAAPRSIS